MVRYCFLAASLLALPLFGQTPEITGGSGGFLSGITRDYRPRPVPNVGFDDSSRLEKLMRAGTIYLSLRDAIALALENNLDLEYARFNPRLSHANLQRAQAGQLLRNVSSSISSGPSSASLGVLAGASALVSTGGGGGGGGQGGVLSGLNVQLAGSSIPNLDPVGYVSYQAVHTTSPQSSTFVTGTNFLVTQYQSAIIGVQKGFLTGTTVSMGMSNTLRLKQNSPTNDFNPFTSAGASLSITQNLLQGFGIATNNRAIRVARNQLHMSDLTFQQQVIATVTNVVNLYWDLVSFQDNARVRRHALELNRQLYSDNKRRAELGVIAGIDIIQTEAEMKSAQQDVTNAERQVLQQEMTLKSVLTRSGLDDMRIAMARIVPTSRIEVPDREPVMPVQDLVKEALASRPEMEQNRTSLENARISMLGTKSALRPTLQAFVNLQNNGQAGDVNSIPVPVTVNGITQYVRRPESSVNQFFLGGYSTVLRQLLARNFPNYSAGLTLSVPIHNRAAQADMITDELNYRQSQIQDKQFQNNIRLGVINNWMTLSQARAAYDTSVEARRLQSQTLEGQRKRYELGSASILDVLIAQRDAINRELAEVDALSQYVRTRTNLQQVVGRILSEYSVDIQDAVAGVVKREPDLIPAADRKK
jgi:outer membrane protein TolC